MTLNHCGCVVSLEKTSKLEALALFRINLLATRLLSRWCPAYRWRESDAGFYRALREPVALMPREKHKRLNLEYESTDARHWDGATRSSEEAAVLAVERRGCIRGPGLNSNCKGEEILKE